MKKRSCFFRFYLICVTKIEKTGFENKKIRPEKRSSERKMLNSLAVLHKLQISMQE